MKHGVVIVGSGLIARFHARAVKASHRLELKGFCDTYSLASAQKAAAEFGSVAWGDFDSAFSSDGVGFVTVATASGKSPPPADFCAEIKAFCAFMSFVKSLYLVTYSSP